MRIFVFLDTQVDFHFLFLLDFHQKDQRQYNLLNNSQIFFAVTPQKTPISKKCFGLESATISKKMLPHSFFKPVLRQYVLYLVFKDCYEKASAHEPFVDAFEYSVALPSKKFMCSTALSIVSSHVSGFSLTL